MSNYQEGHVHARMTKTRGLVHVIAYRVKDGDGKWKQITKTIHTRYRKEAKEELRKRLDEVNEGKMPSSDITFGEFIPQYWEPHMLDTMKPSTRSVNASITRRHLLPEVKGLKLKEIHPTRLAKLLEDKRKAGLGDKSRLNIYLLLASMFRYAISLNLLKVSPLSPQNLPHVEWKEKPVLTPGEISAVIAAIPLPLRALFIVFAMTGVRVGEALGLKWRDVDFQRSRLHIRNSVWKGKDQTPKTRSSVRSKPLVGILARALEMHRALAVYKEADSYVFSNGAGGPLNPSELRKRVLYPAMAKAGITRTARAFGFHILRHSAGTVMSDVTGNLKTTSSFLGHSSTAITGDVYLHTTTDVEVSAMEKLESAMFPAGTSGGLLLNVIKTPLGLN
jgi:integrase